jgi:hypothetical protein
MHKKVSITKEQDGCFERELFVETSSSLEGDVFIGISVIGDCSDIALNQKELAEFISELQKFLNPTHNA